MAREKRKGLLEGDLEQISSKVFDTYHDAITQLVGKRHGVYALYRKGRLYYVGLANNLRSRVKQHLKDKHALKWDTFSLYLIRNVNYLKELESLIVHIAEPKGNVIRGRFAKSESLIDTLRDLMEERDERQREQILSGVMAVPRTQRKKTWRKSDRSETREPPLQGVLPANTELRRTYKGKMHKAKVNSKGEVLLKGKKFNSPSLAGALVRGGKSTNGWTFWNYKDKNGKWVKIDTLRK